MDEIHRILKPNGTVWINLGDTYSSNRWSDTESGTGKSGIYADILTNKQISEPNKCLLLIPHRFAIGCESPKWVLRDDLTEKEKLFKSDYQAYQAFSYLKAWKTLKNLK